MRDDAAVLLRGAGQEAGHVDEGDERDVEAVAEAHEARALIEASMSRQPARQRRLVGDDADRAAAEAREADDDVLGVVALHLEEVAVVDDRGDDARCMS